MDMICHSNVVSDLTYSFGDILIKLMTFISRIVIKTSYIQPYLLSIYFLAFVDEERRVRDEKDKIQEIKDQLRDKTLRVNELEVKEMKNLKI